MRRSGPQDLPSARIGCGGGAPLPARTPEPGAHNEAASMFSERTRRLVSLFRHPGPEPGSGHAAAGGKPATGSPIRSGMTLVFLAIVLGMLLPAIALAETTLTIGHIQLKKDRTYGKSRTFAQYLMQPLGRPWEGAKVALDEVKWHGAAAGVGFALDREKVTPEGVAAKVREMAAKDIRFFLLDLPGEVHTLHHPRLQ